MQWAVSFVNNSSKISNHIENHQHKFQAFFTLSSHGGFIFAITGPRAVIAQPPCAWGEGTCINMFVCILQKPFKRLERTHWHFEGVHGCGNSDRPDNLDHTSSRRPRTKRLWWALKRVGVTKRPKGNHNEMGDRKSTKFLWIIPHSNLFFFSNSEYKCLPFVALTV